MAWKTLLCPFLLALVGSTIIANVSHADQVDVALCASCHGARGVPSDASTPIIWGQNDAYLQKQLRDFRDGDRESQIMSSMAESLAPADVVTVAKLFAGQAWPSRAAGAPAPRLETDLGPILEQCLACHSGMEGRELAHGGAVPRIAGQSYEYLSQTMEALATDERSNNEIMTAVMSKLDAKQRDALARYFSAF